MLSFASLVLAAIASVSAHGTISLVTVGGVSYHGPQPAISGTRLSSAIRQVQEVGPVTDVNSPDMTCGLAAASTADRVIPITAGSEVTVNWLSGLAGSWPHVVGPVTAYMAKCPGSAKDCGGPDLKFFKVQEDGQTTPGSNEWTQVAIHDGKPVTFKVPAGIEDGDYLVRHEVIALHRAATPGGAEFYSGCFQVTVSGGGGAKPPANQLVTFPGAYKATDPGILIDVYNGAFNYQFPGPAVFAPGSGSSAPAPASGPKTPVNAPPSAPKPANPTTAAPSPSTVAPSSPSTVDKPKPETSSAPKPQKPLQCKAWRKRTRKAKRDAAKAKKAAIPDSGSNTTANEARRRGIAAHKRTLSRVMPRHMESVV